MILQKASLSKINKYTIGYLLACAYIFTSYVAQDILISSRLNSLCMYAFLFMSAFIFIQSLRVDVTRAGFAIWYLAFMAISVALMLQSPSFSGVFSSFYTMIVSFLIAICLQLYVKTEKGFRGICWCYSLSSVAFIVLLYLTGNLSGSADDRLGQEVLGNANIFASMMMVGAMLSIWLLIYDCPKKIQKLMMTGIVIFEMYSLALSGGRKFFIVPFIFLYILLWFKEDKRGRRHIVFYTVLFAAILFGVVWLIMNVPTLYNAIGVRMEGFIQNLMGEGGDSSAAIRETIRRLAWDKWWDRIFFGYGFDSFKYFAEQEVGYFYYSHCNYTELLYSGGIFYLLLYYSFYFVILWKALRQKQIPVPYRAFAVGIVLCFLIYSYGAVTYYSTPSKIMLMMANSVILFRVSSSNFIEGEKNHG